MSQETVNPSISTESVTPEPTGNPVDSVANPVETEDKGNTEAPVNNDFSKQFAALSRKEKMLRSREAQLKELEKKYAEASKPDTEPEPNKPSIEELLRNNPLEALKAQGLGIEDILQMVANDGQLPEHVSQKRQEQALVDKIAELEAKLDNRFNEYEKTNAEKEHSKTIENFKSELKTFIDSDESYELIRFNNAYDTVYDVIEEHYKNTGKVLSEKEAAEAVENHLEEEALKLTAVGKLRSKLGIKTDTQESNETIPSEPSLSLSSDLTATSGNGEDPLKGLSREEQLAELAKQLKFV